MIPVVDIFAGPSGLGEVFSSVVDGKNRSVFDISLSIEMDSHAFETLKLRAFYRQFPSGAPPSTISISEAKLHERRCTRRISQKQKGPRISAGMLALAPKVRHLVPFVPRSTKQSGNTIHGF
jgi:hypothetical protein